MALDFFGPNRRVMIPVMAGRPNRRRLKAGVLPDRDDPDQEIKVEVSRVLPSLQEKPRSLCGAVRNRRLRPDNEPANYCDNPAGNNTPHLGFGYCAAHGGLTPAGLKHAARLQGRVVIEKQRLAIAKWGGDRSLLDSFSPEEALLEEVRRSVALVRWLEERIAEWGGAVESPYLGGHADYEDRGPDSPLGGLPTLMNETSRGNSTFTDEREWLLFYREERRHLAQVARSAIDAGISLRLVTLAEDQGRLLATAVRSVLDALNLTPEQQAMVPRVVPGILRAASTNREIEQAPAS